MGSTISPFIMSGCINNCGTEFRPSHLGDHKKLLSSLIPQNAAYALMGIEKSQDLKIQKPRA